MTALAFYIHIGSLCVAVFGIFLADKSAFAWLRGKKETLSARDIFIAHWIVAAGLCGLILSGLYLFWPLRTYLIGQPLFWLKIGFVLALIINSFYIDQLMHLALTRPYSALSKRERMTLIISGMVSTLCWIGAFLAALILFQNVFIDFFL
ncbi:MAG TPA: hypothetical protein VMU27_01810 [Candidatus Paceibacterota bacterium]|nr:hypothetical protein [Candidatus Paceibacterota bacterium]